MPSATQQQEWRLRELWRDEIPVGEDHRCKRAAGNRRENQELQRERNDDEWCWCPANCGNDERSYCRDHGDQADVPAITAARDPQRPERCKAGDEYEEETAERIDLGGRGLDRRVGGWDRKCPVGQPSEEGPATSGEDGEPAVAPRRLRAMGEQEDCGQTADRKTAHHHPVDKREGACNGLNRHRCSLSPTPHPYPPRMSRHRSEALR